jgi:hypothetical protein
MGPVEYLIVEFPGNAFNGDIVPALAELTDAGTIRIIDLLFVKKDAQGQVTALELHELPGEEASPFDELDGEVGDLLNQDDIDDAAAQLEPNTSAALLVVEDVWATKLRDAIVGSGGRLVDRGAIPGHLVEAALEAEGAVTR